MCSARDRAVCVATEQTARECIGIAIEDHGIGLDALAVGETNAADAAIANRNFCYVRAVAKIRTDAAPCVLECGSHLSHSAAYEADTLTLDVCDQHQRRGSREGRRTDISRVAAE